MKSSLPDSAVLAVNRCIGFLALMVLQLYQVLEPGAQSRQYEKIVIPRSRSTIKAWN